jgi:hypothetical protein
MALTRAVSDHDLSPLPNQPGLGVRDSGKR